MAGAVIASLHWLTPVFIAAVVAGAALELWLAQRQAANVARYRGEVPVPFAASVSAEDHAKAADYTIAKVRFGRISTVVDAALTLALITLIMVVVLVLFAVAERLERRLLRWRHD